MCRATLFAALAACSGVSRPVPPAPADGADPAGVVPDSVAVAWEREVGPSLFGPLLVDGGVVLAATGHGAVVALSAEAGERFWLRRLTGSLRGGVARQGDRLFVAAENQEGRAYRLGVQKGDREWAREVGPTHYPPLAVGETVIVATAEGSLLALDAGTGKELWRARLPGAAAAGPLADGESILLPTTTDTLFWLAQGSGEVTGRSPLPATVSAAPARRGGTLYLPLHSGELVAYDLASRQELWRAPFGAPILAAPVIGADGALYVLTRSAELWRVPPGGRAGEKLASLAGAARASLALAGHRLLVGRLDGTLLSVRTDGTVVWRERLDDSIVSPAAVSGGAVFVPLLHGTIVKLEGVR